ncbi:hypothetical protein TcasGA2_TC000036 [Tribolium castaneum]|uniref:Uncharacterized protein n=1 Tax=Tribolium castaneum TaxID=7070 RepID=D7GY34_TRICA|nr:hypothetical protein TcasGA2_TC000036 [Tribolium castaneum]
MTNANSKSEIIDAILKNREIIKNRIHLKQFKEHLTKEEIKKLQKPITDKLDNITEFTQQILMSEANPKNVLAIEEKVPQAKGHQRFPRESKDSGGDDVNESDNSDKVLMSAANLLPLPKSPSSISLDPNKDLNFDIIEKQFKFEKPSHLLSLDIRSRNAKIDTTIPEISTKLKSLNAHLTNAKKSQEQEKIDNLQYVYSQLKKYKSVLEDIRKIPFYEKQTGSGQIRPSVFSRPCLIFSDPNEMVERLDLLIASKNAGNDSIEVYNECVEILDKLLNLKLIKKSDHKRIFSTLHAEH